MPPAVVRDSFTLRQLTNLVSAVSQHTEQYATAVIIPVLVAVICKNEQFRSQRKGSFDVFVARMVQCTGLLNISLCSARSEDR